MKHVNQSMALPIILILGILMLFMALFFIASCGQERKLKQELQSLEQARDSLWLQSRPSSGPEYHHQLPYPVLPTTERLIDVPGRQQVINERPEIRQVDTAHISTYFE